VAEYLEREAQEAAPEPRRRRGGRPPRSALRKGGR
jgi:hypothetical protein